jgi:hypothetical protein
VEPPVHRRMVGPTGVGSACERCPGNSGGQNVGWICRRPNVAMSARSDHRMRAGDLAAQNGELVAQHEDLRVLGHGVHAVGPDQLDDASDNSIDEAERHGVAASSRPSCLVKGCGSSRRTLHLRVRAGRCSGLLYRRHHRDPAADGALFGQNRLREVLGESKGATAEQLASSCRRRCSPLWQSPAGGRRRSCRASARCTRRRSERASCGSQQASAPKLRRHSSPDRHRQRVRGRSPRSPSASRGRQ